MVKIPAIPQYTSWIALVFEHLINTSPDSELCFRPFTPALHTKMYVIWKKYQVFTPVAELLLEELKTIMNDKPI